MRRLTKKTLVKYPEIIFEIPSMMKVSKNTMLSPDGLFQVKKFIDDLNKRKVEGSIVEAGCWKGGCSAYMAMKDRKREVFALDSFEGMPEPQALDHKTGGKKGLKEGDLACDISVVESLKDKLNLKNLNIIKGFFNESIPKNKEKMGKIALLRLDGDFYRSTMDVLEGLYDQVVPGGYIIFDDWHDFVGCRQAFVDFFYKRGEYPDLKDFYPFGKPYFKK